MGRRHSLKMKLIYTVLLAACISSVLVGSANAVCPTGCTCDDENLHVNCVDANLDIVPITLNPSVQRLILKNNRIRSVDTGFTFYHELIHVDLSHNHLVRVQNGSFTSQTKLVQLHLNSNKISQLSNKTFGGPQNIMNSLAVLNLRDNLLENIEPGVFTYTRSLEELDLGQNSIKELNTSAFAGLSNLRILKIDNNELSKVPGVFSLRTLTQPSHNGNGQNGGSGGNNYNMVPHLAELFMGNNRLEKLSNDAFSAAKNLVTLDLRGSSIATIEQHAFRGLGFLRKLILIDNNLKNIPTFSFPPLIQLEVLKIGRNPFEQISNNAFHGMKSLKNLEISGASELIHVEKDAFAPNLDLETIEMYSSKKLAVLPSKLFKSLSGLRNLILKDNALQSLPEDLVSWHSLRTLRVEGNPFHCVCELFWLRDLFLEDKFKNSSSFVLCAEPAELRDRKLISLSSKDLNCYLQTPIQKTILGISIAVAVIFLAVIFFLLYRYHDRIKNFCKRGFRRPSRRKNRSSVIASSGKEMDTATKTSFLSQTHYPFSDEEFQIRASLMSGSPGPGNGGNGNFYNSSTGGKHSMNPMSMNSLQYLHHQNSNSLSHPHQHHHPHSHTGNNYGPPNYSNEYDAPINPVNYPQYVHNQNSHQQQQLDHNLPIHYPLHSHPMLPVKPIPITEL